MKQLLKKICRIIPAVNRLYDDVELYKKGYPPGHYYSPLVATDEVVKRQKIIFNKESFIHGIDLNSDEQIHLLKMLAPMYAGIPYLDKSSKEHRFYFKNNTFEYSDAIFLHLLLRYLKPKRIIEIGSGFSSSIMLDTNETFFNNQIHITFIEPFTERLIQLMKPGDEKNCTVFEQRLQNLSIDIFKALQPGDILFIDSTHVSKTGSDVNTIIFEILPILQKGVIIHFHDIFYPFEYPQEWVLGWSGFGWNEIYILRAFLMNNPKYKIVLFNTFLEHQMEDWFKQHMPICLLDKGGSLWLQKTED